VRAIPDGSCDITAHVALDACADAGRMACAGRAAASERAATSGQVVHAGQVAPSGRAVCASVTVLTTQRRALRALGVTGRRPPLTQAGNDPLGYARALSRASEEAELIDAGGLGAFGWLVQAVGMDIPAPLAPLDQPPA
jgi:hypothetical protein